LRACYHRRWLNLVYDSTDIVHCKLEGAQRLFLNVLSAFSGEGLLVGGQAINMNGGVGLSEVFLE
jgi:hypothetical protein